MPEGLKPGSKVVALASAARSAAFFAGIVTGGVSGWISKQQLIITGAFMIGGATMGWIVGTVVGKILFPAKAGQVIIMKAELASIPATIKGNMSASLVTWMIICSLAMIVSTADIMTIALLSFCVSVAISVVLALVITLL